MDNNNLAHWKNALMHSPATLAIIAINVIIYAVHNLVAGSPDQLLLNPEFTTAMARPWTLMTVAFSHEVLFHLVINMALLFVFSTRLEVAVGYKVVFLVYLLSGIVGSLTVFPLAPLLGWTGSVAGASAAVFGIVAAYSGLYPKANIFGSKAVVWAGMLFLVNAAIFAMRPHISIGAAAHAVGLLVGLACGFGLSRISGGVSEARTGD